MKKVIEQVLSVLVEKGAFRPRDIVLFAQGFADALNKGIGEVGALIYALLETKSRRAHADNEFRSYIEEVASGRVSPGPSTSKEMARKAYRAACRRF